MGVDGAGKTTLLDDLASRVSVGVITGDMLVDGNPRDDSFQVRSDTVFQGDTRLTCLTFNLTAEDRLRSTARLALFHQYRPVRILLPCCSSRLTSLILYSEALQFSEILRQPASTPCAEKLEYVEEILKLLKTDKYADAVVGVHGEGLNVKERKRLSIGTLFFFLPLAHR
jgi:ATP-binding cassette subfamily G (WHITE) protein 2 (PDR)